jgi:hypothetical protein
MWPRESVEPPLVRVCSPRLRNEMGKPVETAVVTLNEREALAVRRTLERMGLARTTFAQRGVGRHGYHVQDWTGQDMKVRHIDADVSGNLMVALVCQAEFQARPRPDPFDLIFLYGCAGANPLNPPQTDVVIVKEAFYAENGLVHECQNAGCSHEETLIKVDKLSEHSVRSIGAASYALSQALGLSTVKAFCSEKIIEIHPNGNAHAGARLRLPYWKVMAEEKPEIIDMESYGFLVALPDRRDQTVAIRVVTDALTDRGDGALPVIGGEVQPAPPVDAETRQQQLLIEHSDIVESVLIWARDQKAGVVPPPPNESAAAKAVIGRRLASHAESDVRHVSAIEAGSIIKALSVLAPEGDLRHLRRVAMGPDSQSAVTAGAAIFDRIGYGSACVGTAIRRWLDDLESEFAHGLPPEIDAERASPESSASRELAKSVRSTEDALRKLLDPTSTRPAYRRAVQQFVVARWDRDFANDFVSEYWERASSRRDVRRKGAPFAVRLSAGPGKSLTVVSSDAGRGDVVWRGFEDDDLFELVVARFGHPMARTIF